MAPPATERWCWALIRILKGLVFDHAAQFFIADDSRLIQYVDGWLEKGLIREWKGVVGELEVGGNFSQFPPSWPPRYIAVHGMRSLADSLLLESIVIAHNGKNGTSRGQFDVIVIAHNGKCANRLLSASGLPLVAKQMKNFDLSSIWVLLAAFDDPLPTVNFEGAFVKGVESLSWMGNNSAKLGNSRTPQTISEFFCFCNTSIYILLQVNSDWRHSTTSPTERDDRGNTNNIIVVGDVANVMPNIQQPRKETDMVAMMRRAHGHCQDPASVTFYVLSLAMHFHGWLSFFITLYYKDVDITKRLDYSSAIAVLGFSLIVSILRTFHVGVDAARVMVSAPVLALVTTHEALAMDHSLPKPWKCLVDDRTGNLYFLNPETNVAQYERPICLPPRNVAQGSCTIEFDGASRGNPGRAGAGAVLRASDNTVLFYLREGLGFATNNVAEYRALILGLECALSKGFRNVRVQGDSMLVCMQQVQGAWRVQDPKMAQLCGQAKELMRQFSSFHIQHELNSEADAQANHAINLAENETEEIAGGFRRRIY
ncbi:unnamed protein product [Brassica oleracea]